MKTLINHNAGNIYDALGVSFLESRKLLAEFREVFIQQYLTTSSRPSKLALFIIEQYRESQLGKIDVSLSKYEAGLFLMGVLYIELSTLTRECQIEAERRSLMGEI